MKLPALVAATALTGCATVTYRLVEIRESFHVTVQVKGSRYGQAPGSCVRRCDSSGDVLACLASCPGAATGRGSCPPALEGSRCEAGWRDATREEAHSCERPLGLRTDETLIRCTNHENRAGIWVGVGFVVGIVAILTLWATSPEGQ